MSQIKPGDVVRLKSGGPKMSVQWINDEVNQVNCTWFDGKDKLEKKNFAAEVLIKEEDDE
ncbi:MAG: DUF2158 domain-containing protein [Candidatus Electryonea clarkiae]|nr:DUF2158 domain-containing protein [Candidatus Electryonea clarkiae]MDP8285803.1 DUF2158 domain-containing protein [Candidatus Electryonea clarkiae]